MSMIKVLIHLPAPLKAKLDALREQGYTASGYIRALLERELKNSNLQKGR
jgi:mannitol/fructose-specific phosphotransferase system IIA component